MLFKGHKKKEISYQKLLEVINKISYLTEINEDGSIKNLRKLEPQISEDLKKIKLTISFYGQKIPTESELAYCLNDVINVLKTLLSENATVSKEDLQYALIGLAKAIIFTRENESSYTNRILNTMIFELEKIHSGTSKSRLMHLSIISTDSENAKDDEALIKRYELYEEILKSEIFNLKELLGEENTYDINQKKYVETEEFEETEKNIEDDKESETVEEETVEEETITYEKEESFLEEKTNIDIVNKKTKTEKPKKEKLQKEAKVKDKTNKVSNKKKVEKDKDNLKFIGKIKCLYGHSEPLRIQIKKYGLLAIKQLFKLLKIGVLYLFNKIKRYVNKKRKIEVNEAPLNANLCKERSISVVLNTSCTYIKDYSLFRNKKGNIYIGKTSNLGKIYKNKDRSAYQIILSDEIYDLLKTRKTEQEIIEKIKQNKEYKIQLLNYYQFVNWFYEQNISNSNSTLSVNGLISFREYYSCLMESVYSYNEEESTKYYNALLLSSIIIETLSLYKPGYSNIKLLSTHYAQKLLNGEVENLIEELKNLIEYDVINKTFYIKELIDKVYVYEIKKEKVVDEVITNNDTKAQKENKINKKEIKSDEKKKNKKLNIKYLLKIVESNGVQKISTYSESYLEDLIIKYNKKRCYKKEIGLKINGTEIYVLGSISNRKNRLYINEETRTSFPKNIQETIFEKSTYLNNLIS